VVYGLFLAGVKLFGGGKAPSGTSRELCDLRHQQIAADMADAKARLTSLEARCNRVEISLAERGREG
jgi:hypothetical protein